MMAEDGILAAVLPEATRIDRLQRLIDIESATPDPLRRLAAVVQADADGMAAMAARLRLSNAQSDRLAALAPAPDLMPPAAGDLRRQRRALARFGPDRYRDLALLAAADGAIDRHSLDAMLALARSWRAPHFPLSGRDVTALGIATGPRVGRLLAAMRQWWEEGDFAADRAACLARLREIAAAERQ